MEESGGCRGFRGLLGIAPGRICFWHAAGYVRIARPPSATLVLHRCLMCFWFTRTTARSSSKEVRIRVHIFFSVYFSREPSPKKGERSTTGGPRQILDFGLKLQWSSCQISRHQRCTKHASSWHWLGQWHFSHIYANDQEPSDASLS